MNDGREQKANRCMGYGRTHGLGAHQDQCLDMLWAPNNGLGRLGPRDLVEEQRDILGNIPRTWLSLSCPRVGTLYLEARVFDFVYSLD